MPDKIYVESFYSKTIQSSMTTTSTSVNVDVAPVNQVGYAVLEIGESNQEMIKWGAVAGLTLSSLLRGLSLTALTDTEVAGNKKTHAVNDTIEQTDVHYLINDKVSNAATETVAGQKTFTLAPISSAAAAGATELVRYGEAVKNTGNETVAGIKTFSSIPVGPASDPSTDNQLARKAYVDARPASKLSFTTYYLGETVLDRDAISSENLSNTQGGSDANFGRDAVSEGVYQAQSFVAGSVPTAFSATVSLKKVGAPADNVYIEIQGDSGGSPDGTPVTNGTSDDVAAAGIGAGYTDVAFIWSALPVLVAGTTYWFVLKRDGANSDTHYYQVEYSSVNAFRSGAMKKYTSSWTTNTGADDDAVFAITGVNATAVKSIYNAYNSNRGFLGFLGFANAAGTKGALIEIQTHGRMTGFTGLTKNTLYHISATAGEIVTTTRNPITGFAVETNSLYVQRAYINTESEDFFGATDITGAEAETLTDGSDASSKHVHDLISNLRLDGRIFTMDTWNGAVAAAGSISKNGSYMAMTTQAANGASAYTQFNPLPTGTSVHNKNPKFTCMVYPATVTVSDSFWGFSENYGVFPVNAALTIKHAGFILDDNTLYASVADGATQTKSASLGAIAVATSLFTIEYSGGHYLFYVNNVLVWTSTANEPADTLLYASIGIISREAGAKSLYCNQAMTTCDL